MISTLDSRGRLIKSEMVGLEPIEYTYDERGRLGTLTVGSDDAARTTTLTYAETGHLAAVTDPLGRTTSFTYDAAGRTTQETRYGGSVITYGYNAASDLTHLTPPGRSAHTFAYNEGAQLLAYTPPVPAVGIPAAPVQYEYDDAGRLFQITQPDGQLLQITYDNDGLPLRLTLPDGVYEISYDEDSGDLQSISAPDGIEHTFHYDGPLVRGENWSGPITGAVSRTFDNALRTATRSVNGNVIELAYDVDSLLVRAGALTLGRHLQHGRVISTSLGTVGDAWSYTGFGGLASYTAQAGGTTLYTVQYTRDKLGRIISENETIGGVTSLYTYSYDSAGRLTGVARNGTPSHSYSYDDNGNRLSGSASYDGQDRLLAVAGATFTYTPGGELQSRSVAGQTTTYDYDALGHLVGVTLPGGDEIGYLLDGLGRRVGQRLNGVLVAGWLYDERGRVVAELDGNNVLASRFVYGSRSHVPDYMVRGGVTYRIISNHLGSPRLVVDSAANTVVQRIDYDAFGNIVDETPAPGFQPIPFGFAGGLYDRYTKFTRFGVRDYDAESGRWTTRDPILFGGQSTNLYAYASNDPINRIDSNGMEDEAPGGGVCPQIFGPEPPSIFPDYTMFVDPKPPQPEPAFKPLAAIQDIGKGGQQTGSKKGGGGGLLGPITPSAKPKLIGFDDMRQQTNPLKWFKGFELHLEIPFYPDFSTPSRPEKAGSPDQKSPDTKPQGPQCKPKLDQPDPLGCES
jgi:RHS repeat-associated protein